MTDQDHLCQHEGCSNPGIPCFMPGNYDADDPDYFYCGEHCQIEGFCYICGQFWAGVEMFDFGPGYCVNCASEVEEPDYDDMDWFDDYAEYEDIIEGETGGRYIGPGSDVMPDEESEE